MWYRIFVTSLIICLIAMVTPAHAANDTPQPNDPQPSKSIDEQPVTIQPVTLSPAASKALASNDYTTVALALFSAQSPADIDALTPEFERLRPKSHLASPQSAATLLQLIQFITGDQYMAGKLSKTHYDNLKKGDIMLRRTGLLGCKQWIIVPLCKYWALVYEHAGLYYGNYGGKLRVYESSNEGGVQFKYVDTWKSSNYYVGIHRSRVDAATIARKFDELVAKYGTNGSGSFITLWASMSTAITLCMPNGSKSITGHSSPAMSAKTPWPPTKSACPPIFIAWLPAGIRKSCTFMDRDRLYHYPFIQKRNVP